MYGLKHVISLPFDPPLPAQDHAPASQTSQESVAAVRPSDFPPPRPIGLFSRRRRGKTVTASTPESFESDFARLVSSGPLPPLAASPCARSQASSDPSPPRRLFVTFSTRRDCEEWLYLLKSLIDRNTLGRTQRRLHLTIWDVQDNSQVVPADRGLRPAGHSSDILSDGKSVTANSSVSQRQPIRQVPVLADWASKEKAAVSL